MQLLFLERPEEPVVVERGPEDRQQLETVLDDTLASIKESSFPAHAGPGCPHCGVASLCRALGGA
jgi:hypothetical protein